MATDPVSRDEPPPLRDDIRAARPYLLSSLSLRAFVRRAAGTLVLVALDIAGLALGIYSALVLRAFLFDETVYWGLLWRDGAREWLPFLIPITLLVFWQAGLYAERERRSGLGRVLSSLVLVAAVTLAFALGNGHDFTTYGLLPTACVTCALGDRPPARGLRLARRRGAARRPTSGAAPCSSAAATTSPTCTGRSAPRAAASRTTSSARSERRRLPGLRQLGTLDQLACDPRRVASDELIVTDGDFDEAACSRSSRPRTGRA